MYALVPLAVAAWIGLVVIFFTTVRVPFPSFLAPLLLAVFSFALSRPSAARLQVNQGTIRQRGAAIPCAGGALESAALIQYLDEPC